MVNTKIMSDVLAKTNEPVKKIQLLHIKNDVDYGFFFLKILNGYLKLVIHLSPLCVILAICLCLLNNGKNFPIHSQFLFTSPCLV